MIQKRENKLIPTAMGIQAAAQMVEEITKKTTSHNSKNGGLVFGKVVSTNPISIQIDGRLTVGSGNIILSPLCVETKLNLKHTHKVTVKSSNDAKTSKAFELTDIVVTKDSKDLVLQHEHTVKASSPQIELEEAFEEPFTLWRGLSTGDTVIVMVSGDSQTYYVLQRAGGIS